jgi:hypothetical protein
MQWWMSRNHPPAEFARILLQRSTAYSRQAMLYTLKGRGRQRARTPHPPPKTHTLSLRRQQPQCVQYT